MWWGCTRTGARTAPDSPDPRLRGRTYAIPFEQVWRAAMRLAAGGIGRCCVLEHDDQDGYLRVASPSRWLRRPGEVRIHIALDRNAQTRVDVQAGSRSGRADLGGNARRIQRFLSALDRELVREAAGGGRAGEPSPLVRA
jgi:hypothetical protein